MVKDAVNMQIGRFRKTDIISLCSSLSNSSIEKALKKLQDDELIEKQSVGKAAYYIRKNKFKLYIRKLNFKKEI